MIEEPEVIYGKLTRSKEAVIISIPFSGKYVNYIIPIQVIQEIGRKTKERFAFTNAKNLKKKEMEV